MSYYGEYFSAYSGNTYDIDVIFDRSSPGNTESTGLYATNKIDNITKDLYEIYTPLGTNSNLQWPYLTNFITEASEDLNATFALNLIDIVKTTSTYTQYSATNGTYITITGSGDIYFNYTLSNINFYMIAGGGGGGAQRASNAGGGGGGGGYLSGTISTTGIIRIKSFIGDGGRGGYNDNPYPYGINGFETDLTYYDDNGAFSKAIVYGGGSGGGGKQDGGPGGCGGGSGSYSNAQSYPGIGISANFDNSIFTSTTNGYYSGGKGEDQNNDSGRGGGGGGCGFGGQGGQYGGDGGLGESNITDSSSLTIAYFSGGGGGGGNGDGGPGGSGQNGSGSGGGAGEGGFNANTAPYFGGGGGGASNASTGAGGNGAKGVIVLYITNAMVTFP
jgi:hypothetical protein